MAELRNMADLCIKEEIGHIPGKFVISVVNGATTVWQRVTDFYGKESELDAARRYVAKHTERSSL